MKTLDYIIEKYKLNVNQKHQPIEIPNTTRVDLARLFFELGFKVGAEIGVERGYYSKILLEQNPEFHLFSIDAWTAYKSYRDHMIQADMDVLYQEAKNNLSMYSGRNTIVKAFSVEAAKDFGDETLDFVYLDANHEFTHVVNDLAAWEPKVKVGGIVAGHDYIKRKTNGYMMHVPMAVHGYIESYQISPLFVLGRKEELPGEKRESTRSWFYVKPPKDKMRPGWSPTP